ncbi:hypothetical protein BDV12DRAFT_189952 [Aspergillus spectabilis]
MTQIPSSAQVIEGFVQNDDVRIHFCTVGRGPLLLLLHGFPDNAETFEYQMRDLSSDYQVVCPTLRGYPPSDIPDEVASYGLAVVMQDILAVLDHFNVEKAILGGHDFGGAVIQHMAFLHPSRIAGLIIINSPILPTFNQLVNFDKEQQNLSQYTIRYHQYQAGDPIDEEYIVRTIRDPARRRVVQEYLASSSIYGMLNYYKKNYPSPPYGKEVDTSRMMYNIPTLIIWGLQDEYFSLKVLDNLPLYFRDTLRLVTLPSAGHWSFRDEYAKVNREIRSWLEELKHV